MTNLIALIVGLTLAITPTTESKTVVTKIHEDDQITVLVNHEGEIKERILHGYDFKVPVVLSKNIPTETAVGKFVSRFSSVSGKTYYQFKSYDDTVWWSLTEDEIGFAPTEDKEYTLLYCNNGTTKENKSCECIPEWDCECEVYDDVFIEVYEKEIRFAKIEKKEEQK